MSGSIRAAPVAWLGSALLVLAAGALGGGLAIAAANVSRAELGVAVGCVAIVVGYLLAGNTRLFCLYGVIGLAPLALAKHFVNVPHMGGATSYSIDLIDPLLLILLGFILHDHAKGRRPLHVTPMAKWVAGMVVLGMSDVVFGTMRVMSAHEVVRMIKCYLLFFILVNEVVRERQFMHMLAALVLALFAQSALGILQGAFKLNLGLQSLGEADSQTIDQAVRGAYLGAGAASAFRSNALLGHPNLLSAFLALQLPICIALTFSRLSPWIRALIALVTAAGSAALMMTLSRSGWVAFGVAIALLFLLSFLHPRLQRRFLFVRIAVLAFVAAVVVAFSGAIIRRVTESDPGAFEFRLAWNRIAWNMVGERPVFGFGLNTFIMHLSGRTSTGGAAALAAESMGLKRPVVHNIYLLTWSEQGTLGFFFFVGLHLSILAAGIRNMRRYYNDVMFATNLGCICGIVALCVDGLASFYLRTPAPARMFWIIAAIVFIIDYWNRENAPARRAVAYPPPQAQAPRSAPPPGQLA